LYIYIIYEIEQIKKKENTKIVDEKFFDEVFRSISSFQLQLQPFL